MVILGLLGCRDWVAGAGCRRQWVGELWSHWRREIRGRWGTAGAARRRDGQVFLGYYLVRALRASDGKQLLSFTADGPVESQIAVAGGIAYFGSEQVYALKGPPT